MRTVLCRHAARTQSCLEKIDCEQGGNYYQQWQIKIGMTEATEYLCSGDAREGKEPNHIVYGGPKSETTLFDCSQL